MSPPFGAPSIGEFATKPESCMVKITLIAYRADLTQQGRVLRRRLCTKRCDHCIRRLQPATPQLGQNDSPTPPGLQLRQERGRVFCVI
jgi:hypothetical protein